MGFQSDKCLPQRLPYERDFIFFGQSFDLYFTFQGFGAGGVGLLIDKLSGYAGSGIVAALAPVMFGYTTRNISSDAGVEGLVTAFEDVDVPHDDTIILPKWRAWAESNGQPHA